MKIRITFTKQNNNTVWDNRHLIIDKERPEIRPASEAVDDEQGNGNVEGSGV